VRLIDDNYGSKSGRDDDVLLPTERELHALVEFLIDDDVLLLGDNSIRFPHDVWSDIRHDVLDGIRRGILDDLVNDILAELVDDLGGDILVELPAELLVELED
jgi:hypothetical protein